MGDLGEAREARDAPVVVRRQLVRRVARGRVDARDLDDDEPDAAARPRLLVRDQPVRHQAVLGHDGVVPRRHDAVAERRAADAERREQAAGTRAAGRVGRHRHAGRMARPTARPADRDRARRDRELRSRRACAEECWNVLATSDALYK